jgi:hypothetical protein
VDWDAGESSGGPPVDPSLAARLERAAAAARLATFAAGDSSGAPAITRVDGGTRPQTAIRDAVLFEKQPGDADAVDSQDVRQDRLGDCYLLAPLAAMAGTPAGRAALRNAIVENKSANGDVVSYTVTFHEPRPALLGETTTRDVAVTVDRLFIERHAVARTGGAHREIWPLVVEKAYAAYVGGYDVVDRPGNPAEVMTLLTGHAPTSVSLDWPNRLFGGYSEARLKTDLASEKLVVVSTRSGIPLPTGQPATEPAHGLAPKHAYFVQGIEEHDGTSLVRLGNPSHDSKQILVPFDELTEWFSAVHVGALR